MAGQETTCNESDEIVLIITNLSHSLYLSLKKSLFLTLSIISLSPLSTGHIFLSLSLSLSPYF
jgi:hypothetical protein